MNYFAEILQIKSTEADNNYILEFFGIWSVELNLILGVVAIITLFFVIRASNASRRQNELQTVPSLSIQLRSNGSGSLFNEELRLVVHKKKMLYKIKINPFYYLDSINGAIYKFRLEPTLTHNFFPEDATENSIPLRINKNGADVDENVEMESVLITFNDARLIISFRDAQNIRYFTLLEFQNGRTRIILAPTRKWGVRGVWFLLTSVNEKCRFIWLKLQSYKHKRELER